jgi:hypothetical protein
MTRNLSGVRYREEKPARAFRFVAVDPSMHFFGRACCLFVAIVFGVRAEVVQLLPDLFPAADSACECELESPAESLEADDHIPVSASGGLAILERLLVVPNAGPVEGASQTPSRRLCLRPPQLRGPPA